MGTVTLDSYQNYINFADNLEKQLMAAYGHKKAKELFQRMDRSRFEAIREAAPNDSLKRQWLKRIEFHHQHVLNGSNEAEAA